MVWLSYPSASYEIQSTQRNRQRLINQWEVIKCIFIGIKIKFSCPISSVSEYFFFNKEHNMASADKPSFELERQHERQLLHGPNVHFP